MLGEATAGLSGVAPRPCLLGPTACVTGQAALGKGGTGSSLHLRSFRFRKGTVALPSGGGWELPPSPPPAFCALHSGGIPGFALARPPRAHGRGANGAEGVRSLRVIANSNNRLGKSWWRRREGDDSSGVRGYQNSLSAEK